MVAVVAIMFACDKETEKYHYITYETSTGDSVVAAGEEDMQAFKGVITGSGPDRYFYQIEGHHFNAATVRFSGDTEGQTTFDGSYIEKIYIPTLYNEGFNVETKLLDGRVDLISQDDFLEGRFKGTLLRQTLVDDAIGFHYVYDTVIVRNGYFKVSIVKEYTIGR